MMHLSIYLLTENRAKNCGRKVFGLAMRKPLLRDRLIFVLIAFA